MSDNPARWAASKERGSVLGMKIVLGLYRLFGRSAARLIVYPIIAYYFLTSPKARKHSKTYLQKLSQKYPHLGVKPSNKHVFKHLLAFGHIAVDKVGSWVVGAKRLPLVFEGERVRDHAIDMNRGALIIGSHIGNMEMMHALVSQTRNERVSLLVYNQHVAKFRKVMSASMQSERVTCIPVDDIGPDTMLLLQDKIAQGEFLYLAGDRSPVHGEKRVGLTEFLGEKAAFPQGPFVLAHLLGCPVYLFFCIERNGTYFAYFEKFADQVSLPRKQRDQEIEHYHAQYAARLEYYCTQAPYQWFNFFDFWYHPEQSNDEQ